MTASIVMAGLDPAIHVFSPWAQRRGCPGDAASFLGTYVAKGILEIDPFISVDRDGVGELVKIGVARGRKTRPDLKVGICGEHGGDPASVGFCHEIGLDYVSCSPYRVPITVAAAQAALGKTVASQA